MNTLWFGDNLHVMRRHLKDETVDLIYLDPPFNSQVDYNVVFTAPSGRGHRAQIQAFEDTWHGGEESEEALAESLGGGGATAAMVRALRSALGPTDMMAYIVMMTVRLIEMRRLLKPTGSLVLHCDTTACHHLRMILDCVFDPRNYVAELVWKRTNARSTKGRWPRMHDKLLHYCKGPDFFFKDQQVPSSRTSRSPPTGRSCPTR